MAKCDNARMKPSIALLALMAALAAPGCGSTGGNAGLQALRPETVGGVVARLRSPSSAVTGNVRAFDYRDGVQIQLAATNLRPGVHRLAIHAVANCSSPNLYSAGPAWAPSSWTKPAGELLPVFAANDDGTEAAYVAFVRGITVDGPGPDSLRGKSVVVHWGNLVGEAYPGQPNNRMACGVFDAARPLL